MNKQNKEQQAKEAWKEYCDRLERQMLQRSGDHIGLSVSVNSQVAIQSFKSALIEALNQRFTVGGIDFDQTGINLLSKDHQTLNEIVMKEIKFRGINPNNKEWVFGFFVLHDNYPQIWKEINGIGSYPVPIDFETLGQFTGLKDKNGKEIYEGDILEKRCLDYESEEYIKWQDSGYEGDGPEPSKILRDICSLEIFGYWLKNETFGYEGEDLESPQDWVVIGNMHENPELLKQ